MSWFDRIRESGLIEAPAIDALGWTLVHSLWEGLAVALVLAIVLRVMRKQSAGARYVVSCGALMLIVLGASVTFGLLNRVAVEAAPLVDRSVPVFVGQSSRPLLITSQMTEPLPVRQRTLVERIQPMLPWLVLAWAGGVIVLGAYQFGGWVFVRRLSRSGQPVEDAGAIACFNSLVDRLTISRPVRLTRSALVQVPSVIGWMRPIVLLPVNALTGLTTDQLRGLLAHELAHVRRYDYLANLLQTAIETLLFYHPAIWWIGGRIRQERENACDDLAASVCDRTTYAQALATMELLRQSPALALSAKGGALLARIRRVLGVSDQPARRRFSSSIVTVSVVIALAVTLIVVSACKTTAKDPTTKPADGKVVNDTGGDGVQVDEFPNATPPNGDDLRATNEEYRIGKGDLLKVTAGDMQSSGVDTVMTERVSDRGTISLKLIGEVTAAGKTKAELEKLIYNMYVKGRFLLTRATISVDILEARAWVFVILGPVTAPGQYCIPKSDFRLLDALVLARDITVDADYLKMYVLRQNDHAESGKEKRIILIPLGRLKQGDLRYNIVIRPDDIILIRPAPKPSQASTPPNVDAFSLATPPNADDPKTTQDAYRIGKNSPVSAKDLQLGAVAIGVAGPGEVPLSQPSTQPAVIVDVDGATPYVNQIAHSYGYVNLTDDQMRKQLDDLQVQFATESQRLGAHDPKLLQLQLEIVTRKAILEDRAGEKAAATTQSNAEWRRQVSEQDEALRAQGGDTIDPATQPSEAVYYIVGGPRAGTYSFKGLRCNVRMALTAVGYQLDLQDKSISVMRRSADGDKIIFSARRVGDVMHLTASEQPFLRPNDVIIVDTPRDNTAPHVVRLVVGIDHITFEGKPITWADFRDELRKLPNPSDTVLELAMASDDVTVGRERLAQGLASSFVRECGLKYLSFVGVHPLGSKAGEETPATQPTTVPVKVGTVYIGGHIKREGVYGLPANRTIDLRQLVYAAGYFDDPKMGDDTRIVLRRRQGEKGQVVTEMTWRDTDKPGKNPTLQADDVIQVGENPPATQPGHNATAGASTQSSNVGAQTPFEQFTTPLELWIKGDRL